MTAPAAAQPLDWMRLPLAAPRRVLIEASAGTGKTHTITLLYLRLILEAADDALADVRGILVSTFTEAAAAELRQRLRARLEEAERLLAARAEGGDGIAPGAADDALARYLAQPPAGIRAPVQALRRVRRARQDLDLAPIVTLHGFCARVLAESAFESGGDPGAGEHVDEQALLEECLLDFWRQRYQRGAVDDDEAALVLRAGPDVLLRDVREYFNLHEPLRLTGERGALRVLLRDLCARERVAELAALASDERRFTRKRSALGNRLVALHAYLLRAGTAVATAELRECVQDLSPEYVAKYQHPDAPPLDREPVIRDWLRAAELLRQWETVVRGEVLAAAIDFCRTAMAARLQQRGGITFGAMIERVRARVSADDGFAAHLFARYPQALLDEFQDTDRQQYAIFDALYRERGTLLLVGDPKQAIYAFRGGDLATYRQAAAQVDARVSLLVNWRSTQAYLDALNALYAHAPAEHLGVGIAYQAVRGGGRAESRPLCVDGTPLAAPLILRAPQDAPLSSLDAGNACALDACAADIAQLLADTRRSLDGRPLQPGDIAVLLPKHEQIAALRQCLARRGVPAAGAGRRSVFDTDTAQDLCLILQALQDGRAGSLRAAWLSDLWGLDAVALRALDADADAQQRLLQESLDRAWLWRTRGPLALCLLLAEHAAARLLARQDGERVLTDLRHLGELLQQQATGGASTHAQQQWLARQQRYAEGADEAHQQRIDSDRARVQLRTLASAKGLQWPLVFLPLAWRPGSGDGKGLPRFHDADDRLCVDLGSPQHAANAERAQREQREEAARLLYVALTRAQQACWVYWLDAGSRRKPGDTPLGALLDAAGLNARDAALHARLAALADALPGTRIDTSAACADARFRPESAAPRARVALAPPPPALPWQQWSFTALTRGATAEPRAAADEADTVIAAAAAAEIAPDVATAHPELQALAELRGAAFGDAVHALLERAGPDERFAGRETVIARQLAACGVRMPQAHGDVLCAQLARRLDALRDADLGDGLRLGALPRVAQVAEMEFLLPMADVQPSALRAVLAHHGVLLPELTARSLCGLLGGFIDRIVEWQGRYHVLDYKSNWLGSALADYQGAALDEAMRAHHYPLQALLYVLALHRYLRQRLPGYDYARHVGDARYLFVRAAGLAPGAGIWRRRFDGGLILALDRLCEGVAP